MARKASRPAKGRAPGRPPRRMADEVRRHQLARESAPELSANLDDFLSYYPQIVERRRADRLEALIGLAIDVAAWGALAAPGTEPDLVERLFAAGAVTVDPHLYGWHALHETGAGDAVRASVRRARTALAGAPDDGPGVEFDAAREEILARVQAFADALGADRATHSDARLLATAAAAAITAIAADRDDDVAAPSAGTAAALLYLLTGRVPAAMPGAREAIAENLDALHADMPSALAHVRADLAGETDHGHGPDAHADEDREDDEDEDGESGEHVPALGEQLELLDRHLATIDDGPRGAEAARVLADALIATSLPAVVDSPLGEAAKLRMLATLGASQPDALAGLAGELLDGFPREELHEFVEHTARMASTDLAPIAPRGSTVEASLERLEALVHELQMTETDWADLEESPFGGLGLLHATADVLRIGVDLGDDDPSTLAALAAVDPLALADLPPQRAAAAARLSELAEAVGKL